MLQVIYISNALAKATQQIYLLRQENLITASTGNNIKLSLIKSDVPSFSNLKNYTPQFDP